MLHGWDRICKRLRSPGIDSKESRNRFLPVCVAWRAGPSNRVFYCTGPQKWCLNIFEQFFSASNSYRLLPLSTQLFSHTTISFSRSAIFWKIYAWFSGQTVLQTSTLYCVDLCDFKHLPFWKKANSFLDRWSKAPLLMVLRTLTASWLPGGSFSPKLQSPPCLPSLGQKMD
jgi:hypothetical protein